MNTLIKLFAILIKAIILLVLIALLGPIAYFGYRMTQPLDMPQFKGLTYFQFAKWRADFLTAQTLKYKQEHPQDKNANSTICNGPDFFFDTMRGISSGPYILVQDYLNNDWSRITAFPYDWYESFETLVWSGALAQQGYLPDVSFCDLNLSKIPTPAQFHETQKQTSMKNP